MRKRLLLVLAVAILVVGTLAGLGMAGPNGNGMPSGAHYNLNIIGVPKDKNPDMDGNMGHRIFVPLSGKAQIQLSEGDFQVLDANGTDGAAAFQLPNPDPLNTGTSWYSVYARALGKPGGSATMQTCAYDEFGALWCSAAILEVERIAGKPNSMNVTKYLLYIYVDLDGDGTAERYNIFNDALEDYFWDYTNDGLRLLQLRFYPGDATTVPPSWP